jgi:hypothetical protein
MFLIAQPVTAAGRRLQRAVHRLANGEGRVITELVELG